MNDGSRCRDERARRIVGLVADVPGVDTPHLGVVARRQHEASLTEGRHEAPEKEREWMRSYAENKDRYGEGVEEDEVTLGTS